MKPIAVFYHCLFVQGEPPQLNSNAFSIVGEQMWYLQQSGLLAAASEFIVGINGADESVDYANLVIPPSAHLVMHGRQSRSENPTLLHLQQWLPEHQGWYVLYFHAKGATHKPDDPYRTRWRKRMMASLIVRWRQCVEDLDFGCDSVGCHWLTWTKYRQMPKGQSIWGGNFWWAKSDFLLTLPSFINNPRIPLMGGIDSLASRFEAEAWIGSGPRLPKVMDYCPGWPR